jgi:NAD(P)-dependent dehydrogenase (short-subunit alcohol dehydrogenase family)
VQLDRCSVVLVTGATSGIGRATAIAFARHGVRLIISGRDRARGGEVADECRALSAEAEFVAADVTAPTAVDALVSATIDRFGRLDVAFNNAGYQERRALLAEQPDDVYDAVFDTNVRALVRAMRAEISVMLSQATGGVIINNVSVSGIRNPNTGLSLYSASKAAALSLTRSAALEYASQGIRINAVSPGRIFTPMMQRANLADPSVVAAGLPLRRLGEPEDVAEAVVWLASSASSFVVGHNLCVDGGFLSA